MRFSGVSLYFLFQIFFTFCQYSQASDLRDGDATGCAHDYGCDKLEWNEDGTGSKIYGRYGYYCGSSARHFYLPVAQRLWHRFTRPTLALIGRVTKEEPRSEKNVTASGRQCAIGSGVSLDGVVNGLCYLFSKNLFAVFSTVCDNPDGHVLGPWCRTRTNQREECYDTQLPENLFPADCVSPCGKWEGYSKWCVSRYTRLTPYGGTWKWC